jgi:hypothetical protein
MGEQVESMPKKARGAAGRREIVPEPGYELVMEDHFPLLQPVTGRLAGTLPPKPLVYHATTGHPCRFGELVRNSG